MRGTRNQKEKARRPGKKSGGKQIQEPNQIFLFLHNKKKSMDKLRLFFIPLALLFVLFFSCGEDDVTTGRTTGNKLANRRYKGPQIRPELPLGNPVG